MTFCNAVFYVRKFATIGSADAPWFGNYGVDLGELARAGLAVPPGFCLGTEAYRAFIAAPQIEINIRRLLAGLRMSDPEDLAVRTEQVRNFLLAQPVPARISEEILQSYFDLGVDSGSSTAPVPVALLASPAPSNSDSLCRQPPAAFLNVRGEADLLDHVKRCWGTLWTARAVACRIMQGMDHTWAAVTVLVQATIKGI